MFAYNLEQGNRISVENFLIADEHSPYIFDGTVHVGLCVASAVMVEMEAIFHLKLAFQLNNLLCLNTKDSSS